MSLGIAVMSQFPSGPVASRTSSGSCWYSGLPELLLSVFSLPDCCRALRTQVPLESKKKPDRKNKCLDLCFKKLLGSTFRKFLILRHCVTHDKQTHEPNVKMERQHIHQNTTHGLHDVPPSRPPPSFFRQVCDWSGAECTRDTLCSSMRGE